MNQKTYNVAFFGTPDFAVPMLETLFAMPEINVSAVVTQPDKPVGKKQIITSSPVKVFAKKNNITVLQPQSIKTKEFEQKLQELNLDAIIIVAYGKIIPENLLSILTKGWLNVHASLLPKYRGASPIQAAIRAGEEKTGVTLMQIDAGLDTGPTIAQKETIIEPKETGEDLHDKLSVLGASILKESLVPYLEGTLKPSTQPKTSPTPLTKTIKKQDGQIDWTQNAEQIERQLRAYTQWPGVYCFWQDKRLQIIEAKAVELPTQLKPGNVKPHGDTAIVGCGTDGLKLYKVKLEGKTEQTTTAFLRGHSSFVTSHLQ